MSPPRCYDPQQMWLVIEEKGGKLITYSFEHRLEADNFLVATPDRHIRLGPIALLRTPLEQGAPLLVAAAQATLAVLKQPATPAQIEQVVAFLQAALDFTTVEPGIADLYSAVRTLLLHGSQLTQEPVTEIIARLKPFLQEHLHLD